MAFLSPNRPTELWWDFSDYPHFGEKQMHSATARARGLRVAASVKATDTQDGVVLLDVLGGMCFPLDQVGTLIWKQLELGNQVDGIAQYISDKFQIPLMQASGDVQEFVQQLQSKGLLRDERDTDEKPRPAMITTIGMLWKRWTRSQRNQGD
jgi:hypothetical protein